MRPFRIMILSALLVVCSFCMVYVSCTKDACKGVNCLNSGTCSGGVCQCPTGVGGNDCETIYRSAYVNTYMGNGKGDTLFADTIKKSVAYFNSTMTFDTNGTTSLLQMNLTFRDTGGRVPLKFSITLSNQTIAGSTFTIQPTATNGFHFSGSGSISASTASFDLTEVADTSVHSPMDTGITVSYTFHNYIKQ